MKKKRILLGLVCLVLFLTMYAGCVDKAGQSGMCIGIYDSRAVACVFAHSEWNKKRLEPKMAEMEEAKAAGDTKKIKELDKWGNAQQAKLHRQGFSTAPVDDILEYIKGALPQIAEDANVVAFVSKWDKKTLRQYKSAEQIDVTDRIAAQFNPNDRVLKTVEQLKDVKPIPLWQLEMMMKFGGH